MSDAPVRIVLKPNGPARVETGSFEIVLADGSTIAKDAPFSLCRCGASNQKPFCDGSHKTCGFVG